MPSSHIFSGSPRLLSTLSLEEDKDNRFEILEMDVQGFKQKAKPL